MSTAEILERPPERAAPPSALRGFAAVFVAGGLAGVAVGGLGSRIAMRIAALTARDVAQGLTTEAGATIGRITFEGTAFLDNDFVLITSPEDPLAKRAWVAVD